MTEQHATPARAPTFPPGRYGHRREPRPRRPVLTALLAVLLVAATLAIAYRLYSQYGSDEYAARILAETERTEQRVTIRFEVLSRSDTVPATCRVRARARDGAVVGVAEVTVPAGRRVLQTYTLATSSRTFVIDIPVCRAATVR